MLIYKILGEALPTREKALFSVQKKLEKRVSEEQAGNREILIKAYDIIERSNSFSGCITYELKDPEKVYFETEAYSPRGEAIRHFKIGFKAEAVKRKGKKLICKEFLVKEDLLAKKWTVSCYFVVPQDWGGELIRSA